MEDFGCCIFAGVALLFGMANESEDSSTVLAKLVVILLLTICIGSFLLCDVSFCDELYSECSKRQAPRFNTSDRTGGPKHGHAAFFDLGAADQRVFLQ